MIPIKLTIEGLYSYQEQQVIDFTALIEAGLFGIFGRVGSGKSSILEAISFGLYGETERMNKTDNRAYNMMNLKSNRSLIDFEFYNFKDEKYRIYREFKRNSKRFDDVKRSDAILYKWENEEWIPQSDLNIDEVVGLSYENFKRTIIIPQGQFKEFLELGGKARTQMLQQIFGLDRFDLAQKTKNLYGTTKESLNLIEGELKSYQQVSVEDIVLQKEKHLQEAQRSNELAEKYRSENERFQQILALKADFELLANKHQEVNLLEEQLPKIEEQKNELLQFEKLDKAFSNILLEQKITEAKQKEKQEKVTQLSKEAEELQSQFNLVDQELKSVEQQYKTLEYLKEEWRELGLIKEIQSAQFNKSKLSERLAKGEALIQQAQLALEQSNTELTQRQTALTLHKEKRVDTSLLMEIDAWFANDVYLIKDQQKLIQESTKLKEEISKVEEEIENYKFKDVGQWQLEIENFKARFSKNEEQLNVELRQLQVNQELAHFAHQLQDGQPCSLCGSLHHPAVLKSEDVSASIAILEQKIREVKDNQKRLAIYETNATLTFDKKQKLTEQFQELNQSKIVWQQQYNEHLASFHWTLIEQGNKEQLEQLKLQVKEVTEQIDQIEKEVIHWQKEVDTNRKNVEDYLKGITEIKIEIAGIDSEIQTKNVQIIRLSISEFITLETTILDQQLQQRTTIIESIELKYKELTEKHQILVPKLASANTSLTSTKQDLIEASTALDVVTQKINSLLIEHQVNGLNEVTFVLGKNIDVQQVRQEIQSFEVQLEVVRLAVKELTDKLKGVTFSLEEFSQQEAAIKELELQTNTAKEIVAKLAGEIERLERDWEKKQTLTKEFEKIEKRATNLGTLATMFNGAGFVNYVSTIYLKNLCDMANLRFHRLTNNQLSLQLNENNEFEIIDYLNEGKTRSVKTLSGGQSFQVSLSLALALAESVQSLSKSNRNFFFIDEGFGTQDTESVNVVFETLSNLQKENRIVGIISHVDELQEKIPMSLSVVKTEEHGSQVIVDR